MSTRTVYVVDDDEGVRKSLVLLLRSVGITPVCHTSGQDFLDSLTPTTEGCLLVDIRMPGMSGLDLQKTLSDRSSILPIIFITGHGDVAMAVRAMRAGAFDFIEKPFRDQDLLDRIVSGQANKVIANELGLSERTVEIHRAKVMSKINVHSLAELVALVTRTGGA
jgi:FixJ family two-component response regulator